MTPEKHRMTAPVRLRILMITQWFDPEPTIKGLGLAKKLHALGHDVQVITGFPNYPGGRIYPGYRVRPFQRELLDGVRVLRVPLYPSHDSSPLRRVLNYTSFGVAATVAALVVRRPDVAYVYHPPATSALPGLALRLLRRVPFVYDVQDLWPETLAATGMLGNARALDLVGRWMQLVYRRAAAVIGLSEGFRRAIETRTSGRAKVHVVHNWADEGAIVTSSPSEERMRDLGLDGGFHVVFAGTMGRAQALTTVLDAAALLSDDGDLRLVLVGGGIEVEALRESARARGLSNVIFLPRRPPTEIGEVLGAADGVLVHLKDDPLFAITVPSKTQAYLMAGRPILMGVRGDAADLVRRAEAGLVFEPESASALAEAIRALRDMSPAARRAMGDRGAAYYWRELSLDVGTRRLADILEHAAGATGGRVAASGREHDGH